VNAPDEPRWSCTGKPIKPRERRVREEACGREWNRATLPDWWVSCSCGRTERQRLGGDCEFCVVQ
jgi:hypothetical protein